MKQTVILLSASQYSMTDEKTGKPIEGTSVRYLIGDNLAATEEESRNVKGLVPAKATVAHADFKELQAPALYELTLTTRVDSKGAVSLVPSAFKFLSGISLTKVPAAK